MKLFSGPTTVTQRGRDIKAWCIFGTCAIVLVAAMALGISGHKQAMGDIHTRALLTEGIDLANSGIYVCREYRYIYDRPNRFSGPDGYLFVSTKPVIAETRNEQIDTPWGTMYWHGVHDHRALPEGWMPYPNYRAPFSWAKP